jgi:SAM-dependent methyltransferase
MADRDKGYVDSAYLDAVTRLLSDLKRRTYEDLRLEPGDAVPDVGCGPGTDTIQLAALVGPSGRVVGVDHDAEMVAEAERRASEAGVAEWVTHERAIATALPYPADSFDASRSERLFEHLADPAACLVEMTRVTRPGGWVVVLDSDWGSLSIGSAEVDAERRFARFLADNLAENGYSGRRLRGLFNRQGLADLSVGVYGVPFTEYAAARGAMLFDQYEQRATAAGAVTSEELERLHAEWEDADAAGAFFASVTMVLVSGRVP